MRVFFERSGGFTGIRFTTTIDTQTLSPQVAQQLREMVEDANFFDLPPILASSENVKDSFHYRVTVETQGQQHTVEVGDQSAPEAIKPLLNRLSILARSKS